MGNWIDIPVDDTGLFLRTYDNTKFYIKANVTGSAAAFVLDGSRYRELLIYIGTTNPGWQYRSSGSWDYMGGAYQAIHYGQSCWEYQYLEASGSTPNSLFTPYNSVDEAIEDYFGRRYFPITYRLTNCTAPDAPVEAAVGDTVSVPFVFPDGYGIVNSENVYVTNNGVVVPSTYSDGVLTFEMPNPG